MPGGHRVVAYDRSTTLITATEGQGATSSSSLEDLIAQLPKPRGVWVMVLSGNATEDTVQHPGTILHKNDIVINGGLPNFMMMLAGPPTFRNVAFLMSMSEPAAVFVDDNSAIA